MVRESTRRMAPRAGSHARARAAYYAFLGFVVAVYTSLAQLVPGLTEYAPSQLLIVASGIALAWSCLLCQRRFELGLAAGGALLYLLFAVVCLSPLWSLSRATSLHAVAESLKYLAVYVAMVNVLDSHARVRTTILVISAATLAPAIGAIHSGLTGVHTVEGTRAAWIGAFGNPNFLAYHLVVATPLALALRETIPGGNRRQHLLRALPLLAIALYGTAILLTESRGGFFGLGAVVLLWLARDLARGRAALGLAGAIVVVMLVAPGGPWQRSETHATLAGEVDASAQGRLDAWRTALRIVANRPGLGTGVGTFIEGYGVFSPGDAGPARSAHNSFLLVAAELGLPALFLFCGVLGAALFALSTSRPATNKALLSSLKSGISVALFGFVVCSLTGDYTFSWPLFFLLGLATACTALAKNTVTNSSTCGSTQSTPGRP
ncbi:MAG: O-antigen ligase family protein [Pseudomonadota bacterium]